MPDRSKPSPDAKAAHELLSELRTRISTQPLPYQHGVEARALESLWEVFAHARAAMRDNPGCERFASAATHMLNVELRPVTAKWHRAHAEGRLGSRDGADAFRADLAAVQSRLRAFADVLHVMAYDSPRADVDAPPAIDPAHLRRVMAPLAFGISDDGPIPPPTAALIRDAETAAILARRGVDARVAGIPPVDAVGLGLSGGGIRSASFCLGVVQVLADRGLLRDVDYLSTVSGGGYIGAFLTRRLADLDGEARVASPHGPDTEAIRYLRQHAKYLSADTPSERWAMVASGLAGLVLNWTAPLFLLASCAFLLALAGPALAAVPWALMLLVAGVCFGAALFAEAVSLRVRGKDSPFLSWGMAGALGAAGFGAVAWTVAWLQDAGGTAGFLFLGAAGALLAAAPTLLRFLPVLRRPPLRNAALRSALLAGGLAFPFGAVLATYGLWRLGRLEPDPQTLQINPLHYGGPWLLGPLVLVFGVISLCLLDINLTGPHRLYRRRLARTFVRRREGDPDVDLAATNSTGRAPYHLINAAADLPSSKNPALRERRCDFFLFSRAWCGSPAIGYHPTGEWRAGRRAMDLATAMAISGAAISPHTGLGSIPSLSALLSFLNVRLNYWIKRPGGGATFAVPGFGCLLKEMSGFRMDETRAWISLSDGGHIENMGVYELLRRRCKLIISVDGEADPQSTFQGHLTLVRHAQIDFGIRMEPDLRNLRPDLRSRFSQTHATMVHVRYPMTATQPAGDGLILYLKLSVTGNEAETIRRYRLLQPDFPHQTTLDQFFDEEQFEVYRQLGVHVAEGLFSPALVAGNVRPATVKAWFTSLASQMLEPE